MQLGKTELGRAAENAAASFLSNRGFTVLGRNLRVGRLEIDLLVRRGELVAVVEVRTRSPGSWVPALTSVDWRKRSRVRAAGTALWRKHFAKDLSVERMRFDLVSVTFTEQGAAQVEHVEAAF